MAANLNNDNLNGEILVFDSTATTSKEDIFPVRIDALMIILVTSGSGKIGIDLSEYELRPNTLIVIQPKNYIFLSDFSSDFKYSAVACSRHVVEDVLPKLTDLLPLLLHHRAEPVTMLNDKEADGILNFYKFLREKLQGPQTPFLKQKVLCMLQAALYEMMEINTPLRVRRTEREDKKAGTHGKVYNRRERKFQNREAGGILCQEIVHHPETPFIRCERDFRPHRRGLD